MIIKAVELWNIRSYEHERIEFEKGITLLSGDIGTGKSTILKSLEFALFGLSPRLSGESLLRHGKQKGKIRVELVINGKEVIIERTLKRNKTIQQDKGILRIDGIVQELSPTELKARIIELLNYPKQLLSRNKDILFRYTVYTPQEEMKQIILEKPETRLEILRKLFGVEKYSRIRDNTILLARSIRQKALMLKETAGRVEEYKNRIQEIIEKEKKLGLELEERKKQEKEQRERIEKLEGEYETINKDYIEEKKRELELVQREKDKEKITKEIRELEKSIIEIEETIKNIEQELMGREEIDLSSIEAMEKELLERQRAIEEEIKIIIRKIGSIEEKIRNYRDTIDNINSLETCPLCHQKVTEEHKEHIRRIYGENIEKNKEELEEEKKRREEKQVLVEEVKNKIDELRKKKNNYLVIKEKEKRISDLKKTREEKTNRKTLLLEEVEKIDRELMQRDKQLGIVKELEKKLSEKKELLEQERNKHTALLTRISSIEKEIEMLKQEEERLGKELQRAENARRIADKYEKMYEWLRNFFSELVANMEINVLASIHNVFNELFSEWFNKLVDSQEMNARLDNDFSPIIEQQGYEVGIEALSGGERTSVALAYRLALNTVLNKIIEGIHTKGLLILDEPTEGFSSEQLERVGEILRSLEVEQLIIVSHEPQLEGFVDRVIKIRKENGVSTISSS
ncbi:AAA family ATPase [Candidatus Woesearchaeota archaeon]|nr:AAA family ATPase [Candidatus Woesearchaeota archaeon]